MQTCLDNGFASCLSSSLLHAAPAAPCLACATDDAMQCWEGTGMGGLGVGEGVSVADEGDVIRVERSVLEVRVLGVSDLGLVSGGGVVVAWISAPFQMAPAERTI
jgi:hypothetical protein